MFRSDETEMVGSVGFLGTGAITEAVVIGLCTQDGRDAPPILVSPRNADRAAALAQRFPKVTVASDNQVLVDASDILCLALHPDAAEAIIADLRFREDQKVVSFISPLSLAELRPLVAPAATICRMVPLPPAAEHLGPVALCPPQAEIAALFEGIGTLVQVEREEQLKALLATTAMMAPFFGFLDHIADWLERQQVEPEEARRYVGAMLHALAVTGKAEAERGFAKLIIEHSTAEGLNEQALRELERAGWGSAVAAVLDLIQERLNGRATFGDGVQRASSQDTAQA